MSPTEMVQCHPPMSLPASNTPPNSPDLLPSITLSDDRVMEMADAIAAMKIALPPSPATHRSPLLCQTCSTKSPSQVALEVAQQIKEALTSTNTKQELPPPPSLVELSSGAEKPKPKPRASMLEFKRVSEVWDKVAYKYKIVEPITPPDGEEKFDEYVFVVRTRIDRKTQKQIHYIDIKFPSLRDALRTVLKDVDGICLQEEKPSVEPVLAVV